MSENNRRERSRAQQRNWDDASNQRSFDGSNDQNQDTPRLTQSDPPYADYNGPQGEYQQNQSYPDWNNRGYQDQSRQSYPSRSYDRQQHSHNGGQHGQNQYGQQYNNNFRQQYSGQQFGGQPFSSYPGPQQSGNGNNQGRWNEGSYREGQYGNSFGRNNSFSSETGQEQNRQGRSNEQGNLWSGGPHKGKGPKGYQRSDERIKEDISDRMAEDGLLDASNIEIEVEHNEVILSGSVDSRESKRRAEELCESIPGVNNVENRLHISQETNRTDKREAASIGSDSRRRNSLAGSAS